MIRLDGVRKTRGQDAQRYSLQVDRLHLAVGERVALVGPSGCGKSTLLDLLALVLAPDAAQGFVLGGEDVAGLWRGRQLDRLASWRSRHLGYVLQAGGLLGFLAVRGNIPPPRQLLGVGGYGRGERPAQALDVPGQLGKKPVPPSLRPLQPGR
ncbi:ATP-binding cassette domain-containing protein, partial [Pseudomonas mosselii]|uniref:ATP-binding cassette domain-containing protein n=1 Tax=Pseudomonas mosselii TaxID=78327 RepID=UPI002022B8E5